jgi:glycolate oxidase
MLHSPLITDLRSALGGENVLSAPSEMVVYDCDAYVVERHPPEAVVFPRSAEQVAAAVEICRRHNMAVVPRAAGTSLAGGCVPLGPSVVLMLTRMNRILDIDLRNRMAVVEPGVVNVNIAAALRGTGFHYAPDPSSQTASLIGGNAATNAGGPHTLKYGVTVNHVLGVEAVLADGSIVQIGPQRDPGGYDLLGLLIGSEGTLGIITKIWLRLTPDPQDYRTFRAIFDSVEDATNTASAIIAAGIIPAALELMDQGIMEAVEAAYHFGFPPDAAAVLIIEIDGPRVGLDAQESQIAAVCKVNRAREVLQAKSAKERDLLWKCRKMASGAMGRLSPSKMSEDCVVPRKHLPAMLENIAQAGRKHGVRIVCVAHAGDGNVHPFMLFDERDPKQVERVLAAENEILADCLALGGSVTAEHGIGVEKIEFMPKQFGPEDLEAMRKVRSAFDPQWKFNPGKLIEAKGVRR